MAQAQAEVPDAGDLPGRAGLREARAMVVHLPAARAAPQELVGLEARIGLEEDPAGRDWVVQADRLRGDPAVAGGKLLTLRSAKARKVLMYHLMGRRSGQRIRTTELFQSSKSPGSQ
jgi:hypothetical protein